MHGNSSGDISQVKKHPEVDAKLIISIIKFEKVSPIRMDWTIAVSTVTVYTIQLVKDTKYTKANTHFILTSYLCSMIKS